MRDLHFKPPGEDDTEHQTQLRGKDNLDSSFVPCFGTTQSFLSDERSEEESTSLTPTRMTTHLKIKTKRSMKKGDLPPRMR